MAKRRVRPEERERLKKLVGRWRRSGQSAGEFAGRHGLSQWALYYWAKRFANEPEGRKCGRRRGRGIRQQGTPRRAVSRSKPRRDLDLIPVQLLRDERPTEPPMPVEGVVEIQLRSGDVVRVVGEVPVERLREIVAAVRQSC